MESSECPFFFAGFCSCSFFLHLKKAQWIAVVLWGAYFAAHPSFLGVFGVACFVLFFFFFLPVGVGSLILDFGPTTVDPTLFGILSIRGALFAIIGPVSGSLTQVLFSFFLQNRAVFFNKKTSGKSWWCPRAAFSWERLGSTSGKRVTRTTNSIYKETQTKISVKFLKSV